MDDRSKLHCHETDFTERLDDANFITRRDVRLTKEMMIQDDGLRMQSYHWRSNIFRSKSDSVLWRRNDEKFNLNLSLKDSINLISSFDTEKSTNIPNTKLQTHHQLFNDESQALYGEKSFHKPSSFHTSLSLSTIPISSLDLFEDKTIENRIDESLENKHTICTGDKETIQPDQTKNLLLDLQHSTNSNVIDTSKDNPPEYKHDIDDSKRQIAARDTSKIEQSCKGIIASQLQINNNETLNEKNPGEGDVCKQNKSNSMLNVLARNNNLMSRPTLADDSKLVKMSLLTNPMNIMQSNVQLLNKSRNFLNFITEKSTNIMEKALLPQHLAMRYNHISKSIETDNTVAFCTNNDSSLKDIPSKSDKDLTTNINNVLNVMKRQDYSKCEDELDSTVTSRNDISPSARIKTRKMREDFENEAVQSEKKCCIFERNDVDKINYCDITDEQTQLDLTLTKINGDKNNLQTENSCNDKEEPSDICTSVDSSISKYDSLEHPLYLMLLEDYTSLKIKHSKLLGRIEYLEKLNPSNKSFKDTQTNTDACTLQEDTLEKTVNKLMTDLNVSLAVQEVLRNECTTVNRDKENMVMKYVSSEKQLIDSQRARDSTERKVRELLKDQELLQSKLRQSQGERARICNIFDGKCREVADLQKEIEKLKEDIKMKEIKLKWTQNKLKTEMDSQKDTQQKLDKALMKINDMKEECDQIRRETQESFRKFQQSEENKAVTLDQQLKEHQARLILERHVTEDKETLRLQLQKELDTLKSRQQDLIAENKTLTLKVQESEKARLNYENNLSDLKILANQRQEQIVELSSKVSHLETLKLQLQHKEECIASTDIEMQQLRLANEELQSDMQACRQKEAEMLDFTQKLTDKNVHLQSDFIAIQTRVKHLESENGPLRDCINELTKKVKALQGDLMQEQQKRREECEILAQHVAEQTQLAQNFVQKLEDSQGENAVLKRKHQISIKEMTRELQQCRKKLEIFEAASPSNSLDIASRTGSNTSLNTGDTLNGALSDNNANGDYIQSIELNRQLLMERVIKLQEKNVKKDEKIDFLEEHTQILVKELQKKKKIIQNYILQQNFGALGCNERDKHKAELARHGGIMASLYNHRVSDENMTLELSLEINQKLEALLEDTLLKNITLKDNIDTLGNEIAKLTMQHQQRKIEN